jgi:hypothetical protein
MVVTVLFHGADLKNKGVTRWPDVISSLAWILKSCTASG